MNFILTFPLEAAGLHILRHVGAINISEQFRFVECMLLGTILAAVDPVAVCTLYSHHGKNVTYDV